MFAVPCSCYVSGEIMTSRILKKIEVKKALAEKYERLASVAGSQPKKTFHLFHAKRFRNQVKAIEQSLAARAK